MEEADGLNFDFEGGLDSGPTLPTASVSVVHPDPSALTLNTPAALSGPAGPYADPTAASAPGDVVSGRRSFRQTVCRHWLRGLCMKGDACGFLHQYDKSRMPVCRFFRLYGECREQDCVYKHTNEDIKECNMYKLGFCPNGPDCRYRHAKLPGPPPSVEEVLQKIQQINSFNYGPNRFYQQRHTQQAEKFHSQGPTAVNQCPAGKASTPELNSSQQQNQEAQQPQQQVLQSQIQNPQNGMPNQGNKSSHPLPQGVNRYFIVKSCNRENFELSVQQGVWATQRSNESKLNEAFDSAENVILIFSVNRTRHFQGCAKMTSRIGGSVGGGNWKHAHGTAHYGRNFSVKWLKLCELSFFKTRYLRNPYNENLQVKISRDCQELEPSVGEQLASLLYVEPDSELMAISLAAEAKREEEKAKGVNPENGVENPDIVPFDDNEEEEEDDDEEEESEEEEDGLASQGRGRGRMMWPPQMPLARGVRPMPGMRGFPPGGIMGNDRFSYGPDGFGMPDIFGVAPRGFGPYGPRFSGSNMMFHGRPPQAGGMFPPGGYGMMPFMGGMGPGPRAGRPMGMSPVFHPPPTRAATRDQRTPANDRSGRQPDQNREPEMGGAGLRPDSETPYQTEDQLRTGESESEDEAPRRSRHGEGKKKRRSPDGEAPTVSDH